MRKAVGAIKGAVKSINSAFIAVILVIFYFIAIGAGKVIYQFFGKTGKAAGSYWEEAQEPYTGRSRYRSPY